MRKTLSVIIPTGDRAEAFRLCELWLSRQTRKPDEIIVVDDGMVPIEPEFCSATQVIRPIEPWTKENTQARNLTIGIAASTGDIIAFIEDDDHYAPNYLEHMANLIESGADIAGELRSIYYHVPTRQWLQNENEDHASLCQTVISRRMSGRFADILQYRHSFYDVMLWKTAQVLRNGWKGVLEPYQGLCLGMKGLPGRAGIGSGHYPNKQYWNADPDLVMLKGLIGEDWRYYKPFMSEQNENQTGSEN